MGVRYEQHAHVTPTTAPRPKVSLLARVRARSAVRRAHRPP
jgi:hypothetical protein